jgi:hypothetical protein
MENGENHKDTKNTKIRKNLCALCVFVVFFFMPKLVFIKQFGMGNNFCVLIRIVCIYNTKRKSNKKPGADIWQYLLS